MDKLEEVIKKENKDKAKKERISIRVYPSVFKTLDYITEQIGINKSDFVRDAIREKIKKTIIPKTKVEERFLTTFGVHRKVAKKLEEKSNEMDNLGNEIEKIVTDIDVSNLTKDELVDFLQELHLIAAVCTGMLRKKHYEEARFEV